jgi:hypothetical protein
MTIKVRASTTEFINNFDKIFGSDEERKAKREAEKEEFEKNWANWELQTRLNDTKSKHPSIQKSIEPFKSPIDGSIISCRSHLREHNKKHGVTDIRDYSGNHFEKRGKEMYNEQIGNNPQAKRERQQLIEHNLHKAGILK